MSVVGFDIGNENCVIAAVKQRGVDVLLNDESKRETPAMVCFGEKQRFLGPAAAASAVMNLKSTVSQVKRLSGRKFKEPQVQNELKMLPFETCESPDGGISIKVKYMGEIQIFSPVQILGMVFGNLKEIAEKNLEMPVVDCVIGVPSYFTDLQRRDYLNAASIAGLKPLRLIHDNTATALGYGIYKTDFPSGKFHVAFVDIGHCDTQVSIVCFEAGQMKILSHAFDSNLGGRDFDEILFNHFAVQFKEKYHIDVYSNLRACIRLRAACEKLKKVLSANAEAALNIECLMEEKDVKGFIKRGEFEDLSCELIERISFPCKRALVDSGISLEKINLVEVVGSGSRIPAITRKLSSLFGREISRTINASECVARGCALQCAMLSPAFRVREYEVQDSIPFSIGLSSDEGPISTGSNTNGVLFPKGQPIPSDKVLTFQCRTLFHLEAYYANPNELPPGVSPNIGCFTIGPFQGSQSEKARIKVRVRLNLHGVVTLESAMLLEDHVDDSAARHSNGHPRTDKMESESSSSGLGENHNENSVPLQSKSTHASGDDVIRDKGNRRFEIPVSENIYGGITRAGLIKAQEEEHKLSQQDRAMERTKNKKNALESYVYEMRNTLFNVYRSFATDGEREGISRNLQETEEWLYDEGDDETEQTYTAKMEDLKKVHIKNICPIKREINYATDLLFDPIVNRYKDGEARVEATRNLLQCIVEHRMSADSLPTKEKELINNECNKAEQWIREKSQQQDLLPKNNDPVLWSNDIKSRTEDLKSTCKHILRGTTSSNSENSKESERRERM